MKKTLFSTVIISVLSIGICGATNAKIATISKETPIYDYMGSQIAMLPYGTSVVLNGNDNKYGNSILYNGYNAFLDPNSIDLTSAKTSGDVYLGVCKLVSGTTVLEEPSSNTVIAKIENEAYGIVTGIKDGYFKVELGAFAGYVSSAEFSDVKSPDLIQSEKALEMRASIVKEAQKYLGIDYVWSGTTTNGFDCSGLVQYIYKQFDITIPRVSRDQCDALTPVGISELLPGDLVFFKKGDNPVHHVGIYVGNGQMIHAPYTGTVVQYQTLREGYYREVFYRGGRIIF